MEFDDAFRAFKAKHIRTKRVIDIQSNEFGFHDITVLFYDKYIKTPPLTISVWESFPVDVRGVMSIKNTFELMYDAMVLNDPNSWDVNKVTMFSQHYKSICKLITDYELRNS